jgi:hypothetical protein
VRAAFHRIWLVLTQLARLGVLCFFSIRASLRMCEYSVTDQQLFQPTYAIIGATTELLRCRLTLKNFAWNEHWLMFVPYGMLKEVPNVHAAVFPAR